MNRLMSADMLALVDDAWPCTAGGPPPIGAPVIWHNKYSTYKTLPGPVSFDRGAGALAKVGNGPLAMSDMLANPASVVKATEGVDLTMAGHAIANPFQHITADGAAKLKARGIDVEALKRMKARMITGSYAGAKARTFVNRDPNMIMVFGEDFFTHGGAYSLGPVLLMNDAHFMGPIVSSNLVWCVDNAFPREVTVGKPVILCPSAYFSQVKLFESEVWHGDYGFRHE
jgi:hypothetical protein